MQLDMSAKPQCEDLRKHFTSLSALGEACWYSLVLGPIAPLTPDLAHNIHMRKDIKVMYILPSIIEGLLETRTYGQRLSDLDCVMHGGGPLSRQAGDQSAQLTFVVCLMGSTETMLLPTELTGSSD